MDKDLTSGRIGRSDKGEGGNVRLVEGATEETFDVIDGGSRVRVRSRGGDETLLYGEADGRGVFARRFGIQEDVNASVLDCCDD